jgi:hypothetical protein
MPGASADPLADNLSLWAGRESATVQRRFSSLGRAGDAVALKVPHASPVGPPLAPAPHPPTYTEIAHAVRMLDGESAKRVRDMMNAIFELANTQPDSIDWANPDYWINERLSGDVRRLARKIWEGSGKTLNPRYLYGHHKIINRLKLLELVDGTYLSGERGRQFLAGERAILAELMGLRVSKRRASRPTPPSDAQSEE